MEHEIWLHTTTRHATQREIAERIGATTSSLSRHLTKGHLPATTVIAVCRAYDYPPVQGLIETGYLHPTEATTTPTNTLSYYLQQATNQQLIDEIMARSNPNALTLFNNDY